MYFLALLATLSVVNSNPVPAPCSPSPVCKDLIVPVTATANQIIFPPFNSTTANALHYISTLDFASQPRDTISGTFNISVRYCKPTVEVEGRQNTIQMLLHGAAYTKVVLSNPSSTESY
jgi:hypothetical protein